MHLNFIILLIYRDLTVFIFETTNISLIQKKKIKVYIILYNKKDGKKL